MSATLSPGAHALSFAEYHALDAWGSGSLRAMRRGPPARVLWERDNPREDTDATILGSAVHCALLTPDLYALSYAVKPAGMSFATKEGKAWRDAPERAGQTIISFDAGVTVEAIVDALQAKSAVAASLNRASAREQSLLWKCGTTGELCKGRPDWIEGKYIYDLKVSRYASSGYLAHRAFTDGWMHQSAHYRTGADQLGVGIFGGRLVVVDPLPPHFVYTLEVKADSLDILEAENRETLKAMRACRESGAWPGTPEQWTKLEIPAAALAQMGESFEGEEEGTEEAA